MKILWRYVKDIRGFGLLEAWLTCGVCGKQYYIITDTPRARLNLKVKEIACLKKCLG